MYVAAMTLRHGKVRLKPGDAIPDAVLAAWGERTIAESVRVGTIVFIPPELLVGLGGELATSPPPTG